MSEESNSEKPYQEQRLEICQQCPEYHFYRCKKCWCFMPLKVKIPFVSCPLNKWGPETSQQA